VVRAVVERKSICPAVLSVRYTRECSKALLSLRLSDRLAKPGIFQWSNKSNLQQPACFDGDDPLHCCTNILRISCFFCAVVGVRN